MVTVLQLLLLWLPVAIPKHAFLNEDRHPFELVLYSGRDNGCTVKSLNNSRRNRRLITDPLRVIEESRALEWPPVDRTRLVSHDLSAIWDRANELCRSNLHSDYLVNHAEFFEGYQQAFSTPSDVPPPPLSIQPIVKSGPSSNRVDLVFFADGYTSEEEEKFFADAKFLAEDITQNQTFNTVEPLLNIWAAFTPSNESGIGVAGIPKNTTFGLFRPGTELRGVYYEKPEVAHAACDFMGVQCDYPILLGNDPLYGGLGGEFTVITSSLANGPLVLRHELGHSVIDVGEEYDGGFAYFGVNAADIATEPISWSHWLSASESGNAAFPAALNSQRVERSVMPLQDYAWTMLNISAPWTTSFDSSGRYSKFIVRFSLSGVPSSTDLHVELDGVDLQWVPRKDIDLDRWHYDLGQGRGPLSAGPHEVKFTLKNEQLNGTAQLCSVEILEFGDDGEFVSTPGHYGIYPTFSEKNETTYRPTNEDCLMRIVTTPNFCNVCREGLWLSLLSEVGLIDGIEVSQCQPTHTPDWTRTISLQLLPLAQFRPEPVPGESYEIAWLKDGVELKEFANKTSVHLEDGLQALGTYRFDVTFHTDEVRKDADHLLSSSSNIVITSLCT